MVDECNFGNLRDIIVPPYAVSVPRIEMDKETIFGIQINRTKVRSNSTEWPSGGEMKSECVTDGTLTPNSSMTFPCGNSNNSNNSSTPNANSTNPNNNLSHQNQAQTSQLGMFKL